jgi:hypothetical protein
VGWSARRIGSILWTGTQIRGFNQFGWYFEHSRPVTDLSGIDIPSTATLYNLTVPVGISMDVQGLLTAGLPATDTGLVISAQSPYQESVIPNSQTYAYDFVGVTSSLYFSSGDINSSPINIILPTNESGQVKLRCTGTYLHSAHQSVWITSGWYDSALIRGI